MVIKKVQKNSRQKKVLKMVTGVHLNDNVNLKIQGARHSEDALRRQMLLIKKDYTRLMVDVRRGYGLAKHWVGLQAASSGEMLKSRFIKN